jgi:hypothetical protein
VGYDSAGQHAADAAGVRGITVFAGAVSDRFRSRWSVTGNGLTIPVNSADSPVAVREKFARSLP